MDMTTPIASPKEASTSANDEHFEMFHLIWLDHKTQSEDSRDTRQRLRGVINRQKKFHDVSKCQTYIEKTSPKDRLIMIVNGQLGKIIVPDVHHIRQVISIYVYCMNKKAHEEWAQNYPKVQAVITELDELVSRITGDHKIQKVVEEPLSINIFNGQSTAGVNGKFVFSQVLIDCLLRLKSTETDKQELIKHLKEEYAGNKTELKHIRDLQKAYSSKDVLWWYSRESFFYKTLNTVLRNKNIHMMFLFRQYIVDMQHQLESNSTNKTRKLYRGQRISTEELETLEQNRGQLISVNSFFSTSHDEKQAASFLTASDAASGLKTVLFEITAGPGTATTKPFADISRFSEFAGESEVLFMAGSIFRLNEIDRSNGDEIAIIRMTLCSENESDLKDVLLHLKEQHGTGETNLQTLGNLLWEMGELHLAQQYFDRLLNTLPANDYLLSAVYKDLAKLASFTNDYEKSVEYHKKSLELKELNKSISIEDTDESTNEIVNDSYEPYEPEDNVSFGSVITRYIIQYTIHIYNNSSVTRKVLIGSDENVWEWKLLSGGSESFDFRSFTNTMYYMYDYVTGTRFDIYGRRAPMWNDGYVELCDDCIKLNEKLISNDERRSKNGRTVSTAQNPLAAVISTDHQESFEKCHGRAASITGAMQEMCKDKGGFMSGDGCAIGKKRYSHGIHKVCLRLDYGNPFLGIISEEKAKRLLTLLVFDVVSNVRYHELTDVYGWCTKTGTVIVDGKTVNDKSRGASKQWSKSDKDGDIFELTIDSENQRLSIINKRTQEQAVMPVEVSVPWRLFVTFCDTISQVVLVTNREPVKQ